MGGNYGDHVAEYNREYGGMPEEAVDALRTHNERVANSQAGNGFRTTQELIGAQTNFKIYYQIYSDGSYATYFNLEVYDAETDQRYSIASQVGEGPVEGNRGSHSNTWWTTRAESDHQRL